MGSVMDQERPWEREEKPMETMRQRIARAAEFGRGAEIDRIIDELENLEEQIAAVNLALQQHIRGIVP